MLTAEQVGAIREQKMFLWIYGYVQYKDFLGDRHITRFCKMLLIPEPRAGVKFRFTEFDNIPEYMTVA